MISLIDPISIAYFVIAFLTGIVGALFGIGGGIIIVPTLTLLFNVPLKLAVGASIVAVVATSVASTGTYVKSDLVNMRLGMFLEMGTSFGALIGAVVAVYLPDQILYLIFAPIVLYAAYIMYASSKQSEIAQLALKNDWFSETLHLNGSFAETASKNLEETKRTTYYVEKSPEMLGVSVGAGIASGLFGVGGGFIKVPALVKICKVPMKTASATSNFMIGVTASTSAIIWLKFGYVEPLLAIPVAFGTLIGALLGSKLIKYIHGTKLRAYFAILLVFVALTFITKAL